MKAGGIREKVEVAHFDSVNLVPNTHAFSIDLKVKSHADKDKL